MLEDQLRAELNAVYNSLSWRITAPLRFLSLQVKRLIRLFRSPKQTIKALIHWSLRQPILVSLAKKFFHYFPNLKHRIRRIALNPVIPVTPTIALPSAPVAEVLVVTEDKHENLYSTQTTRLSSSSQAIFFELQAAIKNKK